MSLRLKGVKVNGSMKHLRLYVLNSIAAFLCIIGVGACVNRQACLCPNQEQSIQAANLDNPLPNPEASALSLIGQLNEEQKAVYRTYQKMGRDWSEGRYMHGPPDLEYARLLEIVAWYDGFWEGEANQ